MFKLVKQGMLAAGILGLGATGIATAQGPAPIQPIQPMQPTPPAHAQADCGGAHFGIFGEFLYLTPRNSEVPFAQPVDSLGLVGTPTGRVGQVEPGYQSAWRLGITSQLSSGMGLSLTYTRFDGDESERVDANNTSLIRSLVTHPATLNQAFDSLSATATHSIKFDQLDATGSLPVYTCDAVQITALTGIRWGRLEQNFNSEFSILGRTTVDTSVDFDGVGPQIGLGSEVNVGGGLIAYGKGMASFLVGKSKGDYRQENEFAGVLAETGFDKTRIVPVLELELGIGWQSEHFRATLGYTIINWRNLVTTNGFIQSVQEANFTTNRDNLRDGITFDGLTARLEVRW